MIYVGTSGYGYHDWNPAFYPPGLPYEDYLAFYSERFSCCELSSTCYRVPGREEIEQLLRRSSGRVLFTVKAHRRLTHQRGENMNVARLFAAALAPLDQAGKLAAVMAQFPMAFINNPANRAYVCRLRAALDLPLVVEFRNDSWFNEETLDFLRGWNMGLVCVDAPELAGLPAPRALATSGNGYVRFHGRNGERWWNKDGAFRFDYCYSRRELLGWVPRIKEIDSSAEVTFVIFNNHWRGQAVANALELQKILNKSRTVGKAGKIAARAG